MGAWAIATSVPALRSQYCATTPPRRSQDRSHSSPEGVALAVPRSSSVGADAVMANDRLGDVRKGLEPGFSRRRSPRAGHVCPSTLRAPTDRFGRRLTGWRRGTNVARTVPIPVPHPQPWPPTAARRSTMGRIATTRPAHCGRSRRRFWRVRRKAYAVSSTLRYQQGLGSYCIAGGNVDPGALSAAPPHKNRYHFFGDGRRLSQAHAAARRSPEMADRWSRRRSQRGQMRLEA